MPGWRQCLGAPCCWGRQWCWCIPICNKEESLTRMFLGHKLHHREDTLERVLPGVCLCTLLGKPLWGRVNEKRIRSCYLDDPPSPHTSNRFLPKHTRQRMAVLSLKPSREGLPKSVLQSLVTLYTGKSCLASSLSSYPCVPPTLQKLEHQG